MFRWLETRRASIHIDPPRCKITICPYDAQSLGGGFKGAADSIEAGGGGFLKNVLPDADDFPSPAPELAGDAAVAGHVVGALFIPKLPVGFRAGVALGAAVPEAPIDEDSDFLLGKSKVGLAG